MRGGTLIYIYETWDEFLLRLELTNVDTIRLRYRGITRAVNMYFRRSESETDNSLYLGSYARNTVIEHHSDLDIAVILPEKERTTYDEYSYPQLFLLEDVKEAIKKTYSQTKLRSDGQVVVVSFSDGMRIEVVPMIPNRGAFVYPDTHDDGEWKNSDPKKEQEVFRALNKIARGNAVKLGRMLRAWRYEHDVPVSGVFIDTLAARFVIENAYGFSSSIFYDWLCRDFFKFLGDMNSWDKHWTSLCHTYTVKAKGDFRPAAQQAYKLAIVGEDATTYDDAWWAWRQVFGSQFPYEYG